MEIPPPALAQRVLRWCLSPEDAEVIGGDLEEALNTVIARRMSVPAARRWYWRQVVSIVCAHALARARPPGHPHSRGVRMGALRQDVSYAVRSLRSQPGFVALAVGMLAIGIGANVAIFALV